MREVHIPIASIIGEYEDAYGFVVYGFMAWHIDMYVGYDWETGQIKTDDVSKIVLHINSEGGSVTEGFAIYNKLQDLKNKGITIETINEGKAYSIATLIYCAASEGQAKAWTSSMWMTHKPWASLLAANADEARKFADFLDNHELPLVQAYMAKTGRTQEEIEAELRAEEFINSTQAKERGYIDEIISVALPGGDKEKADKKPVALAWVGARNNQPIPNHMNNKTVPKASEKEKASFVSEVVAAVGAAFGLKPKNETTEQPEVVDETVEVVAATVTTDEETPQTFYFDGEAIETGTALFLDAEMSVAVEDGEYGLSDGRTITVVEGQVTAIAEAEEEEVVDATDKDAVIAKLRNELKAKEQAETRLKNQLRVANKAQVPGGGKPESAPVNQQYPGNKKGTGHPLDNVANLKK